MSNVNFHRQFLIDLVTSGDAQLPTRVLRKVLSDSGEFRQDKDDHRYSGIDNAWIRVVSRGRTAFRVIYINNKDGITFYRAGPHSVEDNLAGPDLKLKMPVSSVEILERAMLPMGSTAEAQKLRPERGTIEENESSPFLKNHERRRLYEQVLGRRLLPHKEATLVSPYISFELLRSTQPLGRMFDQWITDDCCTVTLITQPPSNVDFTEFNKLEARGFSILYVQRLHAKAYGFRLNKERLSEWSSNKSDLMLLGSANLTTGGFNPTTQLNSDPQLELSYQVPESEHEQVENFFNYLAAVGISHEVFKHRLAK